MTTIERPADFFLQPQSNVEADNGTDDAFMSRRIASLYNKDEKLGKCSDYPY
jgi:hypothetical protein